MLSGKLPAFIEADARVQRCEIQLGIGQRNPVVLKLEDFCGPGLSGMQETETPGPIQGLPIGIHRNLRHCSPVVDLVFFWVNRLEREWVLKG